MKFKKVFASVLACVSFCLVARADPIRLLKDSSDTGFKNGADWDDNGNAPAPGKDYLVDNGHILKGDYSYPFDGDSLQLGIVGGTEGVLYKVHQGEHTFKKLILANGFYRVWLASAYQFGKLTGPIEVLSPATVPFRIYSTHLSGTTTYLTYLNGNISGAEGTGLLLGYYPNDTAKLTTSKIYLTGDNSAYFGQLSFLGTNMTHVFMTSTSLGGALGSLKYDAVVLKENTTLQADGANMTLASALNRGLRLEAPGGRLDVGADTALRLEWPISGSGTLTKTGAGVLTLAGPVNPAAAGTVGTGIELAEGKMVLAEGFSNVPGRPITVEAGTTVSVAPGDEVTVNSLVFNGGALAITCEVANSETNSGVLVLGEGSQPNWPIPVYPQALHRVKVPFLKVPMSAGAITPECFVQPDDFASSGLPAAKFTVETDGEWQTAYAETRDLIYVVDRNPTTGEANTRAYLFARWTAEDWMWSDGKFVHADADYEARCTEESPGGKTVYHQESSVTDYVFPGLSLGLYGCGEYKMACLSFNTPLNSFTCDLYTGDYARICPNAISEAGVHICGRLDVGNTQTSDRGLGWRAKGHDTLTIIDSIVSGSGVMSFVPDGNSYTNTYYFTADNSFNGKYFMYGSSKEGSHTTLKFAKAGSFGTNPATLTQDAFLFQDRCELYPVGSQRLEQSNREFVFYGTREQSVRVDDGETFELVAPLAMRLGAAGEKVGRGTWAIGGTMRTYQYGSTDAPTFTVREGFIRPDNPRVFANVAVTVAEGAGIAAKYRPGETSEVATYGMIVTDASRFTIAGDTLTFKVKTGGADMRRVSVPVLTVPAALAADIDAKKIVVSHDTSLSPVVVRENVTISDVSYVRYSCKFKNGLALIVR